MLVRTKLIGTVNIQGQDPEELSNTVGLSLDPGDEQWCALGDYENTQDAPSVINVSATVDPAWPHVPSLVGAYWESDEGNNTRVRTLELQSNGYQYKEE